MKKNKLKARLRVLEAVVLDLQGRIAKLEEERSRVNWTINPPSTWDPWWEKVPSMPYIDPWIPNIVPDPFKVGDPDVYLPPITIGDPYVSPNTTTDAPYRFDTVTTSRGGLEEFDVVIE